MAKPYALIIDALASNILPGLLTVGVEPHTLGGHLRANLIKRRTGNAERLFGRAELLRLT